MSENVTLSGATEHKVAPGIRQDEGAQEADRNF